MNLAPGHDICADVWGAIHIAVENLYMRGQNTQGSYIDDILEPHIEFQQAVVALRANRGDTGTWARLEAAFDTIESITERHLESAPSFPKPERKMIAKLFGETRRTIAGHRGVRDE